jgi:hypothetical protein
MPTKTTKKTSATKSAPAKSRGRGRGKSSAASAEVVLSSTAPDTGNWVRVDLHMHTLGSHDYEQPDKTYLDILRQAERRGLRMIAFTDHNTVNGYRNMMREIEMFELLEKSDRIRPDELSRLVEYRRLLKKIVVLPGFEFTATFGFHILGIFPPDKPVREIEHVLMQLKVPNEVIDKGLTEAGATSDVLTAYQLINAAGGIAIAAHANSSSGVSMRNMNLGGQTRIAFTQDPNLLAIEFTDLDKGPRRSSAYLFSGVKPEYPRRMHAIQGSDAHRVVGDPSNPKRLGVGDRATELQIESVSFKGLRDLLSSQDFDKVRPAFDRLDLPPDMSDVISAREAGPSATIAFYPALPKKGDRLEAPLRDIAAMANGDGGTIFLGCGDKTVKKTAGLGDARKVAAELTERLKTILPQVSAVLAEVEVDGKPVLRINVLAGKNAPYALNEREFYLRKETESVLASRDELVALIKRVLDTQRPPQPQHQQGGRFQGRDHREPREFREPREHREPREQGRPQQQGGNQPQGRQHDGPPQREQGRPQQQGGNQGQRFNGNQQGGQGQRGNQRGENRGNQQGGNRGNQQGGNRNGQPLSNVGPLPLPKSLQGAALAGGRGKIEPKIPDTPVDPVPNGAPRTGVQVLSMDERNGSIFFTVRDLRNNSVVRNVTMKSARDLWHYAISQYADNPGGPEDVAWQGNRSVIAGGVRAGKQRYDLVLRDEKGSTYVFYGVMQEGLDENWKSMIAEFDAKQPAIEG